ncbi:hypothetical protein H0X06_02130 [Candidatus Dependentiae bacterium]|nr:hypothetical protein [Candidatus Dependentiae bacterium]
MKFHIWSIIFISLYGSLSRGACSVWSGALTRVETAEDFHALCMDIWTRTDLVQAINAKKRQRKTILHYVRESLFVVSLKMEKFIVDDHRPFYKKIILSMKCSFKNAFSPCRTRSYKTCISLFNSMLMRLKGPVHLEAKGTSYGIY